MPTRSILLFSAGTVIIGALTMLGPKIVSSMAQSPPELKTVGSMVPSQSWPWSPFDSSEPRRSQSAPEGRRWGEDDEVYEGDRRRSGLSETYRTVCVRLCDGFYW